MKSGYEGVHRWFRRGHCLCQGPEFEAGRSGNCKSCLATIYVANIGWFGSMGTQTVSVRVCVCVCVSVCDRLEVDVLSGRCVRCR